MSVAYNAYGAAEEIHLHKDNFVADPECAFHRRRFNNPAIVQAILIPCLLFVGTLWLLSFQVHYYHATQCWFLIACGVLVVLAILGKALLAHRQGQILGHDKSFSHMREPTWFAFLAATCLFALVLAIVLGQYNYTRNTSAYHGLDDLSRVTNVDPSVSGGKAYLDASVVVFAEGTFVDGSKSLGFKDGDVYCVAPITIGKIPLAMYDFWAVGVNCCNPFGGNFWCGAVQSATAQSGLRIMDDAQRAYYRLAVQQATDEYNLQDPQHPLFFTWAEDPSSPAGKLSGTSPEAAQARSHKIFAVAVIVHVIFQCILVWLVVGHYQKYLQ